MKKLIFFLVFILILVVTPLISAICTPNISGDLDSFLSNLSSANTEFQNCPIELPNIVKKLMGDGTIQVNILMDDGTTEGFSVVISSGEISGIGKSVSKYSYLIETDEPTANSLINNKFSNIYTHYNNGNIKLSGGSIGSKIKLFFAKIFNKIFGGSNSQTNVVGGDGQPENCHETYLPGWEEYSFENTKEQWDKYSSETDGVCQFDVGTIGPKSGDCVYTYQKIKGGATSWLCWYNN